MGGSNEDCGARAGSPSASRTSAIRLDRLASATKTSRPEPFLQFDFRQDARTAIDECREQLERLWRYVQAPSLTLELPRVPTSKREGTKGRCHEAPRRNLQIPWEVTCTVV